VAGTSSEGVGAAEFGLLWSVTAPIVPVQRLLCASAT
jgi:hypothetical protein